MSHTRYSIVVPTLYQMLLLVQTNVSARVDHDVRMTLMNEAQMGMLEQVKSARASAEMVVPAGEATVPRM